MVKVGVPAGGAFGWFVDVEGVDLNGLCSSGGRAASRQAAMAMQTVFPGLAAAKLEPRQLDSLQESMRTLDAHGLFHHDYNILSAVSGGGVAKRMPMSRLLMADGFVTYNYGIAMQFSHYRGGATIPALPALGIPEKSTAAVYGASVAGALAQNRAHAAWLDSSGVLGSRQLGVGGVCDLVNRYGGEGGKGSSQCGSMCNATTRCRCCTG